MPEPRTIQQQVQGALKRAGADKAQSLAEIAAFAELADRISAPAAAELRNLLR